MRVLFTLHPESDALFLDIDGTLLDIAPSPDRVIVPHGLIETLHTLHRKMAGALALVSGRPLTCVEKLLDAGDLPAAGSHGSEWRMADGAPILQAPVLPPQILHLIKKEFEQDTALLIEDKTYSLAIHYRQKPERRAEIEAFLDRLIAGQSEPLAVMAGKLVFEIVRPEYNKGAAVAAFMKHPVFSGRRPLFLGDDITDAIAIDACKELGGSGFQVGQAPFASPEAVRNWLQAQAAL
jgi:trehalose 6-phosphate phosphatase